MANQRILFELSPIFIPLCLALGVVYAWLLYNAKHLWGKRVNQFLFALRAILVAVIAFLLIGPILKLTQQVTEKPSIVFLVDNSFSVKQVTDSLQRVNLRKEISGVQESLEAQGYEVAIRDLKGGPLTQFNNPTSDLSGSLKTITADFEGKNLSGMVLVSDGIYNTGASPLYPPTHLPIYSIGIGDTTQRIDLVLKNLAYNKIAYQGNQFPLRAEVLISGLAHQDVKISVFQSGKKITEQTKNSGTKSFLEFDVRLDAIEKGLQRVDVVVEPLDKESNKKNNRASAFVEVVEGKKKILMIAAAPHPDIKAIRSVVEKNPNYEFILHLPGVKEADESVLQPGKADLIIFREPTEAQGKLSPLFANLSKGPASIMILLGASGNLRQLPAVGIPVTFESSGQWDDVTPIINPAFRDFSFSDNIHTAFSRFPPMTVPFGKFKFPPNATILIYQRIGNVDTERPLAFSYDEGGRKTCVFIGAGFWRWRLNEFSETGKSESFDEVFSKLIQYLSTLEERRKFKSFPIQNEFTDAEPVIFESQVYNDLFEQVYGSKVDIEIKDERGKVSKYSYVTNSSGSRYQVGGLHEGVYRYTASTELNGKREEARGEFLVLSQNIESQNLTADFGLLRKLSDQTGGHFYPANHLNQLALDLKSHEAKALLHGEESFNPLVNLKWVFFLLLFLVTVEWTVRKYLGSY